MEHRASQSLWMIFAALLFSVMGVCVKLSSAYYHTGEIVFYRSLFGAMSVFIAILWTGQSVRTAHIGEHFRRGAIGIFGMSLWFYAISLIPLAAAMTLNYTSPIWVAALLMVGAILHGGKLPKWPLVCAILCSFVGVVMLLQPSFDNHALKGSLIGIFSGFIAAFAYLQVRQLGKLGEPELRTVFWFSISGILAGLCGTAYLGWHAHEWRGIALLLAVGVSASIAQVAMTRAFRLGNALLTANLQYTGIVFSSLWGIALWQDHLNLLSWLGMAVIILSGSAATYLQHRANAPSEPSAPSAPLDT